MATILNSLPQTVQQVCKALKREYGSPRLGNPVDPLDDLVYTVISNKTSPHTAMQTYANIKQTFVTWDQLCATDPGRLREILRPAGLSTVKSRQIYDALSKIAEDFGSCHLNDLALRPHNEILDYLDVSLKGLVSQQNFTDWNSLKNFIEGQYDIRLESLLRGKSSSIHHLESGMKNKVIMQKQHFVDILKEEFTKS